jgi:hypothetical protein
MATRAHCLVESAAPGPNARLPRATLQESQSKGCQLKSNQITDWIVAVLDSPVERACGEIEIHDEMSQRQRVGTLGIEKHHRVHPDRLRRGRRLRTSTLALPAALRPRRPARARLIGPWKPRAGRTRLRHQAETPWCHRRAQQYCGEANSRPAMISSRVRRPVIDVYANSPSDVGYRSRGRFSMT